MAINSTLPLPQLGENGEKKTDTAYQGTYFSLRLFRVFNLLRYSSLAFTSIVYLVGTFPQEYSTKLIIIVALIVLALFAVKAYYHYLHNVQAVKVLTLLECFSITVLMLFTGGLASPFVWYFLNPLFIAAMYLPLVYTWAYWGLFLSWGIVQELYLLQGGTSLLGILRTHLEIVLILSLITLVIQVFTRLYHALEEKSRQLGMQQDELIASFLDLSQNHYLVQTLSDFQRTAISFKRDEDILKLLTKVSNFVFPFEETAVLCLDEPLFPNSSQPFGSYRLIQDNDGVRNVFFDRKVIAEVRDRWQEFFTPGGMIKGTDRHWIAIPIRLEKKKIVAIFLGQLKDSAKLDKFPGNLSLFIQFTEQVIQSLQSLKQTEETLYHLSSLYEAVDTISGRENPRGTMDLFSAYARKLTNSEKVIFWMDQAGEGEFQYNSVYSVKGKSDAFPEEYWQGALLRAWTEIRENPKPFVQTLEGAGGEYLGQMICVPVKSRSRCFGVLAALQARQRYNIEEILQKLTFLSELSAITIERNMAELFSDKLLVLEEQKRIANEIHDSISQNLFSIVYGLQSAVKQADRLSPELQEQLSTIQDVAARTAKELRVLIYRLSPRHRGDDTFMSEVRAYLDGLANINNTVIDFNVEGTEEFLNPSMRKAFYRIIREATGNAIRHGKCGKINISLEMSPFASKLTISDNGKGFNLSKGDEDGQRGGLGIINMKELAHSLQGNFNIVTAPGEGTVVNCSVPTSPVSTGRAHSR